MTFFPYVPNWSQGSFKREFEFQTEILTSRDGTEQRRALRSTPRRKIEMEVLLERARLREFERLLIRNHRNPFLITDVIRSVPIASALPVSGTSLTLFEVPDWLVEGEKVAIFDGMRVAEFEVDAISGLTVTFSEPSAQAWSKASHLAPVIEGRIQGRIDSRRVTNEHAIVPITVTPTIAVDAVDEGEVDFGSWLAGLEVFRWSPNWSRQPDVTYTHEIETVDYGRGRVDYFAPVTFTNETRQATFLQRNRDEVEDMRKFFARMKGRRGNFYMPSWKSDLTVAVAPQADTEHLIVEGTEIYDNYREDPVFRALSLQVVGFTFYRTILGFTQVGQNTRVQLLETWPFDISLESIKDVRWMPVVRFANDTLVVDHVTDEVSQLVLTTTTIPASDAETGAAELDEAALYMLSTYGWDFTLGVFIDPLEFAVNSRWPEISIGVNPLAEQMQTYVNTIYPQIATV